MLGRLERVDLRQVWSSESGDFTPWLAKAENLKLLSDVINLELDLDTTEKLVGPYRADIVCKEAINGDWVLIENQLERTDHSHLGQLFTYAAGLRGRVTIVWVAERFTDEHRGALDWLNDVTNDDVNLFGIEVELWRIGNSAVAPNFKIVSQPNDWTKRIALNRERSDVSEASETDLLKLEFWTAFRDFLKEKNSPLKSQKPSTSHWTSYAIGRSGFNLSAFVGMRDGYIGVSLVISDRYAVNFHQLLILDREVIENEVGTKLDWRETKEGKHRYVELYQRDIDPTNRDYWPEYFEWLQHYLEAFYRAFTPRVKSLKIAAQPSNFLEQSPDQGMLP